VPELSGLAVADLNRRLGTTDIPASLATTLRNNAGGHWNHRRAEALPPSSSSSWLAYCLPSLYYWWRKASWRVAILVTSSTADVLCSFFWRIMCNPSSTGGPAGELKEAMESAFGSVDAFRDQFGKAAAGRFGSGEAFAAEA
jgi:Fe-Mn family superoxide dismutase